MLPSLPLPESTTTVQIRLLERDFNPHKQAGSLKLISLDGACIFKQANSLKLTESLILSQKIKKLKRIKTRQAAKLDAWSRAFEMLKVVKLTTG
jgi:polynucleotide 5'-kinase involved in rRNA processing